MEAIKAIETIYNGYRFRSRLEARWAVFFDSGKIKYEYEPEGFELPNGTRYLPDFYLPDFDTYAEVKADTQNAQDDIDRMREMIRWGGPIKRIIILSSIPGECIDGGLWHFPCIYYSTRNDETSMYWWYFYDGPYSDERICGQIVGSNCYEGPIRVLKDQFGKMFIKYQVEAVSDMRIPRIDDEYVSYMSIAERRKSQLACNSLTFSSYEKARQARFEHGEKPEVRS